MKTKSQKQFRRNRFIILSLVFLIVSCKDQKKNEFKDLGSTERTDLCELLNEDLLRKTFELPTDIALEKDDSETICSYEWTKNNDEKMLWHSVSLNFARGGQRSSADAQAVWESQSKGIYADKSMQEVPGVGEKATWSKLGGSQLRVLHDGYIFYVSLMAMPANNSAMNTKEEIEKLTTIAEGIINKI